MERPEEFPVTIFDRLGSTNDSILEAGATDAPEWTTHVAREQTSGRGRGDHAWCSPRDAGLWMSVLLRPRRPQREWPLLSLVAGAATRSALARSGIADVRLYWPNDLRVGERKIGGILGETRSRDDRAWLALGVGVNVDFRGPRERGELPVEIEALAVSMVECGARPVGLRELAQAILEAFFPLYSKFHDGRPASELVNTAIAQTGRAVEVRPTGRAAWRGQVLGLGPVGELLVRTTEGDVVAVISGEVIYE